jgi:hypothetical protein
MDERPAQYDQPESALVAAFVKRDRWVRRAAAWWVAVLGAAMLSGALSAGWVVWTPLLILSLSVVGLGLWAWRCPRCGKELEINPDNCKACGLVLRQDEPSTNTS